MLTFLDRDRKVLWSVDLEAEVAGMAPEGGGGQRRIQPSSENLSAPCRGKVSKSLGIFY